MNKKIIAPVLMAGAVISGNALAQSWDGSFSKRVYIGIGAGQSDLKPDTSDVPQISVTESNDTASTATLGFDFGRRLSAELQYADLGTAGLTGGDGIEYSEVTLSGLYYLWNGLGSSSYLDYDGLDQRTGLSLFGRVGVGKMDNKAVGNVQFERENDAQLMVGLGVEYGLKFGLGVRAEFTNLDTDAKYRGLSVLYRFGGRKMTNEPTQVTTPEQAPELPVLKAPDPVNTLPPPPPPPPELMPGAITSFDDSDGDGVSNAEDSCTDTSPGTPVNSNGCALFNGTLEGVNFKTGSDTLTDAARSVLDSAVETLNLFPEVRISIESHTDSQGLETANLDLSRQRALSVVRYLTAQGIPLDRMEARAYGESRPIADNSTREGRLLNRRVEFRTVQ